MSNVFIKTLRAAKNEGVISVQQFKTLKGQYYNGDPEGALKGFEKILKNKMKHKIKSYGRGVG